MFTLVEPESAGQLLGASLAETALLFRKGILSTDKTVLAGLSSYTKEKSTKFLNEAFGYDPPYLHVSNWDSFAPLSSFDFGSGPAASLRLPPPGADALCYILPSNYATDCVLSMSTESLERLEKDLELRSVGAEILGEFAQIARLDYKTMS